ncbi:MAG: YesL family protein [Faecousia sp.]
MNARWQDTPAAVLLRLLADLMIVNLLALICSFGVITAGASLSAMYAVLFQREWDEGMVPVIKSFFKAFGRNFLKATALELILVLVVGVAAGDLWFAVNSEQPMKTIYTVVGTIIGLLALILFIMAFPQQSIYRNSVWNYLKNSVMLAMCAPGQLLLALSAWILPWYLAFSIPEIITQFGVLYLLWGFSLPAWCTVKLMKKVFARTKQEVP